MLVSCTIFPGPFTEKDSCILYINDPSDTSNLWIKCNDEEPRQLLENISNIEDYAVSGSGDLIFFSQKNDFGGSDIWQVNKNGKKLKKSVDCKELTCSEIAYNAVVKKIAYVELGKNPKVYIIDLATNTSISHPAMGTELRFSPNGEYLSFFDQKTNQLKVVKLENKTVIEQESATGLTGGWAEDSSRILFGKVNFWGGIPGFDVYTLSIEKGEVEPLFASQNQETEYYQPEFTEIEGVILVAVRERNSGSSRQLWLVTMNGEVLRKITEDLTYNYSSYQWNIDHSRLLFQRFPIGQSEGQPEIWVWNVESDSFSKIASNAARPQWLP